VAKTPKRSSSKSKTGPTRSAKSPIVKTQARNLGKQAGELLKKPLVREALAAVVVTAVAKRSARKAAREEVREGAPANAGAALGSTVGTIAGEALRGLISKPAKNTSNRKSLSGGAGAKQGARAPKRSTSAKSDNKSASAKAGSTSRAEKAEASQSKASKKPRSDTKATARKKTK
jgi:hypothetical protein